MTTQVAVYAGLLGLLWALLGLGVLVVARAYLLLDADAGGVR